MRKVVSFFLARLAQKALHALPKTLHALPKTLNDLHEMFHGSHKTLNGLNETILARKSHAFFDLVVRFRDCTAN